MNTKWKELINKDIMTEKWNLSRKGANGCIFYISKQMFHSCTGVRKK